MFDWAIFGLLVTICIPGLVISAPRLIEALQTTIEANLRPGQKLPSRFVLVGLSIAQNVIIVAIAAAIGTALAPRVGLGAPFFEALVAGEPLWPALVPQLIPTLLIGISGSLFFLAVYYWIVRPRLDAHTVRCAENLRRTLGVWGRLLYGGIVEEVIVRWGLMSLLVWVGASLFGGSTLGVVWTAIVMTGLLFGLGHLPSHFAVGCRKTPMFIGSVIGLNLWVSLLFGWLFWQYGLLAAILAHMLFHLVWLAVEFRSTQIRGLES
jgi:hypothetical protein